MVTRPRRKKKKARRKSGGFFEDSDRFVQVIFGFFFFLFLFCVTAFNAIAWNPTAATFYC